MFSTKFSAFLTNSQLDFEACGLILLQLYGLQRLEFLDRGDDAFQWSERSSDPNPKFER